MDRQVADAAVEDVAELRAAQAAEKDMDQRVDRFLQGFDEDYRRRLKERDTNRENDH